MKKNYFLILFVLWINSIYAQTTTCNINVPPPTVKKTIRAYSSIGEEFSAFSSNGTIGQSFLANSPYISSMRFYLMQNREYSLSIYYYGNLATPKNLGKKLYDTSFTHSTASTVGAIIAKDVNLTPSLYLKPGSQYYIELKCLTNDIVESQQSDRDIYPDGNLFKNGEFKVTQDLRMEISGGFPSIGYSSLWVYNHFTPNEKDAQGKQILWNASSASIGQTFIATTSLIKSVSVLTGAIEGASEQAEARIYEVDEVTGNIIYKQVGSPCKVNICQWCETTFDWEAQSLAIPMLKVGKKYYVEFQKRSGKPIHIYGWINNQYSQGDAYADGKLRGNGQDLSLKIQGIEPNVTEEKVYAVHSGGAEAWSKSALRVGQSFKATVHYLTSGSVNLCNTGKLNVELYEWTGNATTPKGALISQLDNIEISNCGITYYRFNEPVKLIFGRDYYIEYTHRDGQMLIAYGSNIINYATNKNNYPYGVTLSSSGSSYENLNSLGRLNMTMKGFCGGTPYLGYATGLNQFFGEDPNKEYKCKNIQDINTIGAYWLRQDVYLTDLKVNNFVLDYFFNQSEERGVGGVVAILKPHGGEPADSLKRNFYLMPDFYKEAYAMADRAKAMAEKYKGYHIIWEILNEPSEEGPNTKHDTSIDMERYAELVRIVSKKMKEADPNVWIGAGSLSHFSYWMSDKSINAGLGDNIDFYTYHPYWQPLPEKDLLRWTTSRRFMFTQKSTTNRKPVLFASEYGCSYRTYNPFGYSHATGDPNTPNHYNNVPFMYYVWQEGNLAQSSSTKSLGQTFKTTFQAIRYVMINLGLVNYTADKLECRLYKYSGNINDPKGGQSPIATVSASTVSQYGSAFFDFSKICPTLNLYQLYYVEFYRKDGGDIHYFYSTANVYRNANTILSDGYSVFPSTADFDGVAYWTTPSSTNITPINHNTGVTFDLNMIIGSGGNVSEGVLSLPLLSQYPSPEVTLQNEAAIMISRSILAQMSEGVNGNIIYRQAGDNFGVFNWDPPSIENFKLSKRPAAHAMKNIANIFGKAYNTPLFSVEAWGADVSYVSRINDIDGSLIVAIWQNLPPTNISKAPIFLFVNSVEYVNAKVSVVTDIVNSVTGEGTGYSISRGSSSLMINSLQVGTQPIIVKIEK